MKRLKLPDYNRATEHVNHAPLSYHQEPHQLPCRRERTRDRCRVGGLFLSRHRDQLDSPSLKAGLIVPWFRESVLLIIVHLARYIVRLFELCHLVYVFWFEYL